MLLAVLAFLSLVLDRSQHAVYELHQGDDVFGTLKELKAGDEAVIHAGTYTTPGFYAVRWAGTAAESIVVRGAAGEARPVIVGRTRGQNIVNVEGSHFTLSHIEFRGGSHGLRLGNVDHATITDVRVHDVGGVGISCNLPKHVCDRVTIRGSRIYDTGRSDSQGEGLYLGCQDAGCAFTNGVIERNLVHDTRGSQGDGIEIKPGSFGNVIRDNAIYRTGRPGITVWGPHDPHIRRNVVEGNRVRDARGRGIWVVGRVVVRDNTVFDSGGRGRDSGR